MVKFRLLVVKARVFSVCCLIQSALTSTLKLILAFTSTLIFPPLLATSYLEEVTVKASFCFWVTTMFLESEPHFNTTVAFRSSYVSLVVAVIVISFLPLLPELGVTVIQLSARVLTRDAVQSAVVVNEILAVPPSCDSTGFRFSELGIVISGESSGGVGSLLSSLQEHTTKSSCMNNGNK